MRGREYPVMSWVRATTGNSSPILVGTILKSCYCSSPRLDACGEQPGPTYSCFSEPLLLSL